MARTSISKNRINLIGKELETISEGSGLFSNEEVIYSKRKYFNGDSNGDYSKGECSFKRTKFVQDDEYADELINLPSSPLFPPFSSPSRNSVERFVVIPTLVFNMDEISNITKDRQVEHLSFIPWRNDEPLLLISNRDSNDQQDNDTDFLFPISKPSKTENPIEYFILHKMNDKWFKIELTNENRERYNKVQYLGDGYYFICRNFSQSSTDRNGFIYKVKNDLQSNEQLTTRDSYEVCTFHIGNGIQDAQSNARGQTWVSLYDSLLATGNTKVFSKQGVCTFDFAKSTRSQKEIPIMDEPYAINVRNEDALVYYWDSFPLVKIQKNRMKVVIPECPIVNAHSFAMGENRNEVVLGGGYVKGSGSFPMVDKVHSLFRVSLETLEYEEFEICDYEGSRMYCVGARGNKMYMKSFDKEKSDNVYIINVDRDL